MSLDPADLTYRPARHEDHADVVAFTQDTWADREVGDYIPDVFPEWVDRERSRTTVAVADDRVVGLANCVLLSDYEAWVQGMRVTPDARGHGVGTAIVHDLFDWARERGAVVARNMVFSWNDAGLGQSRATGFEPATEFRWAQLVPDRDASAADGAALRVTTDPDAAWGFWTRSEACRHLRGLSLSREESWALAGLTREALYDTRDQETVLSLVGGSGTRAMTYRVRVFDRETDEEGTRTFAEYGVGAWADPTAADALLSAIARDAATLEADYARVLIPETPRHVTDVAAARYGLGDDPDFVLSADLTADYRGEREA